MNTVLQNIPISAQDSTNSTWHHDCSNLTAFDGQGDNSWPHNSDVSVTFGSVLTSGTYFYSNDVIQKAKNLNILAKIHGQPDSSFIVDLM